MRDEQLVDADNASTRRVTVINFQNISDEELIARLDKLRTILMMPKRRK